MKKLKDFLEARYRRFGFLKPVLEKLMEMEASIARRWASTAHRRLMAVQWGLPPQPEYFDHHIDLFYQWSALRNALWLERGAFGSLALRGGLVLELACGDGFNAKHFYSLRSKQVIACDIDPQAIRVAKKKNSADNLEFIVADIRTSMPAGTFDNVVWDAAIEHFTREEIEKLLVEIKQRLTQEGILSGYTIVERSDGSKSLSHHEYEFKSKEDLFQFLSPYFEKVTVFETIYPSRHNLYFWASDAKLPFTDGWPNAVRK
jgi:SAM-dependent methyltransferase